jgi:hypothetical protein
MTSNYILKQYNIPENMNGNPPTPTHMLVLFTLVKVPDIKENYILTNFLTATL